MRMRFDLHDWPRINLDLCTRHGELLLHIGCVTCLTREPIINAIRLSLVHSPSVRRALPVDSASMVSVRLQRKNRSAGLRLYLQAHCTTLFQLCFGAPATCRRRWLRPSALSRRRLASRLRRRLCPRRRARCGQRCDSASLLVHSATTWLANRSLNVCRQRSKLIDRRWSWDRFRGLQAWCGDTTTDHCIRICKRCG